MNIDSIIRALINEHGYITIDEMLNIALNQYENSYYQSQKYIGIDGDFITAPEISQLFGEIIGIWCIYQWHMLGKPLNINIVELGAGLGNLMKDALRVIKQLEPLLYNNLSLQILEINNHFKQKQKDNLLKLIDNIEWIDSIKKINKKPLIIIANEFFDALPIKQYIKYKNDWYERVVTIDKRDNIVFDKISINKSLSEKLNAEHSNALEGAIIEISSASIDIVTFIVDLIKTYTGSCVIIDYGYNVDPEIRINNQYISTIQAMKNHKYNSLFDNLGTADITTHVDFFHLQKVISNKKIKNIEIMSQAKFLIYNGILIRAKSLRDKLNNQEEKYLIQKQLNKLISNEGMGELFKVLLFFHM